MADGPVPWGRPARHAGPGVFLVELPAPLPSPALDLALVGKWLERVPDLRLDGARPASRDLQARLAAFWLPSQPVLLVGSSTGSVGGRLSSIVKTVPGRPEAGLDRVLAPLPPASARSSACGGPRPTTRSCTRTP